MVCSLNTHIKTELFLPSRYHGNLTISENLFHSSFSIEAPAMWEQNLLLLLWPRQRNVKFEAMNTLFGILYSTLYRVISFSLCVHSLHILIRDRDINSTLDLQRWFNHDYCSIRLYNMICAGDLQTIKWHSRMEIDVLGEVLSDWRVMNFLRGITGSMWVSFEGW